MLLYNFNIICVKYVIFSLKSLFDAVFQRTTKPNIHKIISHKKASLTILESSFVCQYIVRV